MSYCNVKDAEGLALGILDAIDEHISVINDRGEIIFVNTPWSNFAQQNQAPLSCDNWLGVNYLGACDGASRAGDVFGKQAAQGIRDVIDGARSEFYLEYPCHSPDHKRWFMMHVHPLKLGVHHYYIVVHKDITERKLAEEVALQAAQQDGLTGVKNRSYGDDFLTQELSRCARLGLPVSVALVDLDDFKGINDSCGHIVGDKCLQSVASMLQGFCQRPGDCCFRYGGDEFVLLWGGLGKKDAEAIAIRILKDIKQLKIPEAPSLSMALSIGLATVQGDQGLTAEAVIGLADRALYNAKEDGKHRLNTLA